MKLLKAIELAKQGRGIVIIRNPITRGQTPIKFYGVK